MSIWTRDSLFCMSFKGTGSPTSLSCGHLMCGSFLLQSTFQLRIAVPRQPFFTCRRKEMKGGDGGKNVFCLFKAAPSPHSIRSATLSCKMAGEQKVMPCFSVCSSFSLVRVYTDLQWRELWGSTRHVYLHWWDPDCVMGQTTFDAQLGVVGSHYCYFYARKGHCVHTVKSRWAIWEAKFFTFSLRQFFC